MKHQTLRSDSLLLLAAILWGAAFVPQRVAMRHMGPLTFTGIRFALGAAALIPVVVFLSRRRTDADSDAARTGPGSASLHLLGGMLAGLVLCAGVGLQQAGLVYTTAPKAAFITGFYVPLVPILGLLLGQRTGIATWSGAILSVIGLYFLSVVGPLKIERGDGLVMISAVVWAIHVLLIGRLAPRTDPLKLGLVQFWVVAIVSLIAAGLTEQITAEGVWAGTWAILYGGLASVGIAYTLQLVGQRHAPPGHAALVLSLEAVFAAIAGYAILQEVLGPRELLGAAVMLGGMLVSQVNRFWSGVMPVSEPCAAARVAETCTSFAEGSHQVRIENPRSQNVGHPSHQSDSVRSSRSVEAHQSGGPG